MIRVRCTDIAVVADKFDVPEKAGGEEPARERGFPSEDEEQKKENDRLNEPLLLRRSTGRRRSGRQDRG